MNDVRLAQMSQMRIVVIGTSSSGKSTLANRLASILNIPRVELDALHWEPNWVEASIEVFRQRVEQAIEPPSWVVDGNYGKVRDSIWRKAQIIIWLDYPFHVVFSRALFRTIKRAITRERLWAGNQESTIRSFFSKQSILVWVIQTYSRRKREYPELFKLPEYGHLNIIHLRSQLEANDYLRKLQKEKSDNEPTNRGLLQ